MRKVILDTNFLLIPGQFGLDIISELERIGPFEIWVLASSINEMERLSEKSAVAIAKKLITNNRIRILNKHIEGLSVDDMLVRLSHEGYVIATQDRGLLERIRGPVVIMRQKRYLQLKEA